MDGVWSEIGRPNRFEVDLDAVAHNTEVVRKLVGPGPRIFAALKADAYGYGIVEVARTVLSSGADAISLVNLFDGVKLRDHGISAPLLLYAGAWPTADVVRMLDRYDFMPTVLDIRTAELISSLCRRELKVFVKVDVGLERLGIRPDGLVDFVAELTRLPRLKVHGIYAHMHVPDGPEVAEYLQWQFDRFTSALERLQQSGCVVPSPWW
jgi:alanine racemase